MSKNVNGIPIIEAEPDLICFQCGKIAETRPYGPNGEEICFECAMKDEETTAKMCGIKLFGDSPEAH
jgi:hypothetical protein